MRAQFCSEFSSKKVEFPQIKFHHPSSNNFVYINGQKFPSLPKENKGTRTCSFHKDLPEFITSQYTAFSYVRKEERCILCKNFKLGSDSRDVHVRCEDRRTRRKDNGLHGSKVLPLKVHTAVTYAADRREPPRRSYSMSPATKSYSLGPATRAGTCPAPNSRLSQTRHSYTRDCTTRLSWSPLSRLPTREHSTKQKNVVSTSECLSATLHPFNKEQTLPIYHKNSVNLPQEQTLPIYRTYNSPVEHFQPFLRIDHLLGCMKSVLNPVYVQAI